MKLIPYDIAKSIPSLDKTAMVSIENQVAYVKLYVPFQPCMAWYIYSLDTDGTGMAFVCLNDPQCSELGYIHMGEIENTKLDFGLKIIMDHNFKPTPLKVVMDSVKSGVCI